VAYADIITLTLSLRDRGRGEVEERTINSYFSSGIVKGKANVAISFIYVYDFF
jgi:hypothetical protein